MKLKIFKLLKELQMEQKSNFLDRDIKPGELNLVFFLILILSNKSRFDLRNL